VQHGGTYTVVRSTTQSYGDSKISGSQNSQTPEPIDKKMAWVIMSAMTCHVKIQNDRPIGIFTVGGGLATEAPRPSTEGRVEVP